MKNIREDPPNSPSKIRAIRVIHLIRDLIRDPWFIFLLFTLALRVLFQAYPYLTEHFYSRGFFQVVRNILDYLLGWMPFPLVYLLFAFLLWKLGKGIRHLIWDKTRSLLPRLLQSGRHLLSFCCATVALFYWLWGYNYNRVPIEEQLALPPVSLTTEDIKTTLEAQTALVLHLRLQIQADSSQAMDQTFPAEQLEPAVRQDVQALLQSLQFPTPGHVRGRQPFWPGFLLRFGAAGIYNPFTGECNIDRGMHDLTKPYNLAHEFCHGYGFGDEGTCNFLAYLALSQSNQPFLRYSAELDYWRELAGTYKRLEPEVYASFRAGLPSGFRADLDHIYQKIDQYPEFFAAFRYTLYDNYLKAQGIPEGMDNYGKVIQLVAAWRQKEQVR